MIFIFLDKQKHGIDCALEPVGYQPNGKEGRVNFWRQAKMKEGKNQQRRQINSARAAWGRLLMIMATRLLTMIISPRKVALKSVGLGLKIPVLQAYVEFHIAIHVLAQQLALAVVAVRSCRHQPLLIDVHDHPLIGIV